MGGVLLIILTATRTGGGGGQRGWGCWVGQWTMQWTFCVRSVRFRSELNFGSGDGNSRAAAMRQSADRASPARSHWMRRLTRPARHREFSAPDEEKSRWSRIAVRKTGVQPPRGYYIHPLYIHPHSLLDTILRRNSPFSCCVCVCAIDTSSARCLLTSAARSSSRRLWWKVLAARL